MLRLIALLLAASALPLAAAPRIAFEPKAVVASGATPNGRLVWFSLAQESRNYSGATVHRALITPVSSSGTARFELGRRVARTSVWAAVDLDDGTVNVAAPVGSPFTAVAFPLERFRKNAAGELDRFFGDAHTVDVLIVRPKEGAWWFSGGDGDGSDADGARNGETLAESFRFEPVGTSPAAPKHLRRGDVVVIIWPFRNEYSIVEVGK